MEKHLSYWQEDCDIDDFKKWCGEHQIGWKHFERNYIKEKKYKTVLDVGAGLYSEYYGFESENIDIDYTATEITEKFIEIGKNKEINVINAYADNLPFNDNSFDVVLCYDVLGHQLSFKETILELYRVSRHDVIISFFKTFVEEEPTRVEIYKNLLHDGFKVEKSKNTNGLIVHRLTNKKGETTGIYHFYSFDEITKFLKQNQMKSKFYKVDNKLILKISKD